MYIYIYVLILINVSSYISCFSLNGFQVCLYMVWLAAIVVVGAYMRKNYIFIIIFIILLFLINHGIYGVIYIYNFIY